MYQKNTYSILQKNAGKSEQDSLAYCVNWFMEKSKLPNFFFTKSCTQSLELSLLLLDLPSSSEVILPSYSFVSLGNAINNLGLKCIYVDCEAGTMNIDANEIEKAITEKTKAVITINYGGISCDYDRIRTICTENKLYLIEDNAHGVLGKYKDEFLGSIGDISCFSFDQLKNFTCIQGGGISINNKDLLNKFLIASEFGTNRKACLEGEVDYYEWKGKGTNSKIALPLLSILKVQLEKSEEIITGFNTIWEAYRQALSPLEQKGFITLAQIPDYASHNAHMFWLKTKNKKERSSLMNHLSQKGIDTSSHYAPLHCSEYGKIVGKFRGTDTNTSKESDKLLRLPMHLGLSSTQIKNIVSYIEGFYQKG